MFIQLLTDKTVEQKYRKAGAEFGGAVSMLYMGECVGFSKLLKRWEKWEAEYAKRGYRTISLDDFVLCGGYGRPLKSLGEKRTNEEGVIRHAKTYRDKYLGKIPPLFDLAKITSPLEPGETPESRMQTDVFVIPGTERD